MPGGVASCHVSHVTTESREQRNNTEKVFVVERKKSLRFLTANTLKCRTGNMFIYALELWLHSGAF